LPATIPLRSKEKLLESKRIDAGVLVGSSEHTRGEQSGRTAGFRRALTSRRLPTNDEASHCGINAEYVQKRIGRTSPVALLLFDNAHRNQSIRVMVCPGNANFDPESNEIRIDH
jgi:hypothetical protein